MVSSICGSLPLALQPDSVGRHYWRGRIVLAYCHRVNGNILALVEECC